ncbi:MAG: hypothetical protein FH752_15770 [Marinobacter adhaerens]|uniref:Uncharacterized protein n=1 Tax=Marinobacter adhaerens TaxID=1033846 RepID=A0A844I4Y6_9GAMM|nr:hypothetical protein [Marinobacter adhaerens]
MEKKIAGWITNIFCSSFIGAFLIIFAIYGLAEVFKGGFNAFANSWFTPWYGVLALYFLSIYLLASAQGHSLKRRLLSWSFSVVFHLGLLAYIGIVLDFGFAALVLGIPEVIILVLSCVGLGYCVASGKRDYA